MAAELQVGKTTHNEENRAVADEKDGGIGDEDLKHLLGLMQNQKKGIEVLNECVQAKSKDLMVMQRELD